MPLTCVPLFVSREHTISVNFRCVVIKDRVVYRSTHLLSKRVTVLYVAALLDVHATLNNICVLLVVLLFASLSLFIKIV